MGRLHLSDSETKSWVDIFDPSRAWAGFTLVLYKARIPMLLDMNGKIVHSWPEARVRARVRLLRDGSILAIGLGRNVVRYDWEGKLTWEFKRPEMLPHHDIIRLDNGNILFVVSSADRATDNLLEVNRTGDVVWEWKSARHLADYIGERSSRAGDITHINSVQELPPNRLFDSGDERFRPGNLLLSARNLNAVFVIDRSNGEPVWTFDRELDLQHEAILIGNGMPGNGKIQIFDNGYRQTHRYRQSAVLKVDPVAESVVWQFKTAGFYSPTSGVAQPLPNGNVLISSSRGGRVFEVTRGGKIVWQWVPPFNPVRPSRYSYDYCPQLSLLQTPREVSIQPARGYRHVDPASYRFSRSKSLRDVVIDGSRKKFLIENDQCQRVFVPASATLQVRYGLDQRSARRAGFEQYAVRFGLRLTPDDSSDELMSDELMSDEVIDLHEGTWRRRNLALEPYAYKWVQICVETERLGTEMAPEDDQFAYWGEPRVFVRSSEDPDPDQELQGGTEADGLTNEELEVSREHLKALGYVN